MYKHVVIVDFSHFWHAAHAAALNAGPMYNLGNTIIVNAEGKLRTIKKVLFKHGITEYMVLFAEDRKPHSKLQLYPDYRQGRENHTQGKIELKKHFLTRGYRHRFAYSEGYEADDVIATLAASAKKAGLFSIIVTGDRDLWQLMDETNVVLNPRTKELVTTDDVNKAFRVSASHIGLIKSVWGDGSDNIPNVLPRMQNQLLPIISCLNPPTLEHFESRINEPETWRSLSLRCQKLLQENWFQIVINWQLVCLKNDCKLKWD